MFCGLLVRCSSEAECQLIESYAKVIGGEGSKKRPSGAHEAGNRACNFYAYLDLLIGFRLVTVSGVVPFPTSLSLENYRRKVA